MDCFFVSLFLQTNVRKKVEKIIVSLFLVDFQAVVFFNKYFFIY